MSHHKKENNLDPLAQLFIKPLISEEVAVNEEEKEEALLGPLEIPIVEEDIPSKIGPLSVDASSYEDFNKSKFYLQTEESVKKINQLQKNPITNSLGEINVTANMNEVDNIIADSPSLIKSKDEGVELVSDILTYDQVIKIKTFNEEGILGLIGQDWVDDQIDAGNADDISELLKSTLPPEITQSQLDLYEEVYEGNFNNKKDVENINKKTRGSIKVPSKDFTQYYDVYDIKQLDARFEVDDEAFNYIKNTILTNMDFNDYGTFEEFANAAGAQTQSLIDKDPIIAKTIVNANLNLLEEEKVKYNEMLQDAKENNLLSSQKDVDALNNKFKKWREKRYAELLSKTDYEKRAFEYEFTTAKVLEDLYIDYGRATAKDEEGEFIFKDIDKKYREREISEWWYRLRNRGISTITKFKKGIRNIFQFTPSANAFGEITKLNSFLNENKENIERLNLGGLNIKALGELKKDESLSDEDRKIIEAVYNNISQYGATSPVSTQVVKGYNLVKANTTVDEILASSDKALIESGTDLIKSIDQNIKDRNVLSLIEQIDPDADDFLTNVERVLDQSNMLFMFGGQALRTINNPITKTVGVILDLLGTTDIVAQTMSGDIWAVLDEKIKIREGENYTPTRDDYLAELEDPESINMISNVLSTGAQLYGERFSISKMLQASKFATNRVTSLVRGQFKSYLKTLPYYLTARELAGVTEYITEGTQEFTSDINQKYQVYGDEKGIIDIIRSGKFGFEAAKQGRKTARFLPLVGNVIGQTAVELGQISLMVAENFNLKGASTELFFKDAIAKIRIDISEGKVSKKIGNEQIENISTIRNQGLKIPENFDGRSKKRLLNLLLNKKSLEDKIKTINDKDISAEDILQLAEVSAEIQVLIGRANNKTKYEKQVGNILNIINNNEKANVKIIRSNNAKGVKKQVDRLNAQGWKIAASKGLTTNYGTIFQKGDQQVIVLNTKEILEDSAINTAAHEFLHAVLWNTIKNSKGTALALGNDLAAYLKEVNPELMKNSELAKRLQDYKNDPKVTNEQQAEEVLTLFSEAVLDGAIDESAFDGSFGQRLGDLFTRIFNSLMGREADIRFDNGRDVYKFIKDYNKSIKKGKFTKAQDKLFSERAEGDLVKREYTTKKMKERDQAFDKSSKKLGELTTEYKEGDFKNVEQLTKQYQATGRDALKRWAGQRKVPLNLSNPAINEEVTSLLNKEFNSFTRNFDQTKSEASTYMNQIAKRIGPKIVEEATRKTKQVSQDVLTEKGVSPEVSVQPDIDQKQKPTGQRAKVFPNAIKAIANTITGETRAEQKALLKNDITEAILRVGTNPKAIAQYIVKKTKTPQYRKLIKDKLGVFGREQYIKNINSLFANTDFIKAIPVANIKRRFGKLFGIKQIGTTPTTRIVDGKRTDFKKQIYNIPAISKAKLNKIKEYFLAGEKRSQSLFEIIGEGIAVESMNELRADTEFMSELQNRLDFKKSNLTAQDFMQEVEFNLDKRNLEDTSLDVVKASKKRSKRSYSEVGLQKIARSTMRQVGGQGSVFNYKNIKDSQKSTRRTGSIIMIHGFGKDTQGSYNYGKDGSIYKNEKEFEKDVFNTPLTEAEITLLEKFDIPLVTRRGKTYYDKSKAKNSFELGIDEQIIINGKPKSVLQLARTEQRDYRKLTGPEARKRLNNKEFDKLQKAKLRVFKKLAKRIESDLKIDPALKNYWAAWLNQSNDNILHPVRSLAPVEFFEIRKGKKVAEHTFPASQAATIVMNMAIEGKVNENFEFIDKDYFQGSILKTDDVKLIGEGYNYISNMPNIFFDIKNPSTWMRYVDIKVNKNNKGPININNIIVKKNGKVVTLAESFGLKLDTKNQTIDNIFDQNNLLFKVFTEKLDIKEASKQLKAAIKVNNKSSVQVKNNKKTLFSLINNDGTTDASIKAMKDADITMELGNKASKKRKGISVFDFDDTLAYSKSKVIVSMPDGSIKKITPAEFAVQSEILQEQGAEFDFSEFNKVIKGKKGPLADLALKRQEKFGSGDIFVLTARPQVSALSIKTFLDGIGLNIPIENITGLENGSPDAKALWVLSKTAQGYNDFYFADDALPNVQAVKNILDQVDVKSEVQQAKASKKRNLDKEFNTIIEQQSGKKWYKTYSRARAKTTGRKVGTFEFFIPPSAEDFSGLLYKILPKGEKGNLAKKWFKDNLFDPFNEAEQEIISSKISVANDFQALRKNINNIPKNLNKPVGVGNFTHSQALRVYIWNMQGMEIPGLSTRDLNRLVEKIENNADLKVFAEKIAFIQKGKQYPKPGDNWVAGNITSDIIQNLNKAGRKEALQRWQENVDIIFSDKNLNKLEALYGSNFVLALKNSLGRMKSGSNRPIGMNPQVNNLLDWLNNSVGAVMFLNMRSATLQLISSVNFLNWSDNNPVAAARAFANQKQYWSDVMKLLNSDYLVQRRNGLKINVAESEIAEAARKGGMKGTIAYLLNKGFVLTRFADSMAIATGGASFYRNRVNALLKQVNIDTGNVYTKAEAEAKAFDDFYQISEESQQSSRTDRISMQQASSIGRLILNFANTPMQYARIMKKSALDLINGRGDWKTNLSKIAYYGFVQNLIFNAMQQAVFALAFGSDDEEERTAEDRAGNIANGMVDSILRGLGYGGAAVATVKDVIIKLTQQGAKKNPKYEDAVSEVFNFSPAIDSKVRKLRSAAKTFSWNRKEIKRRGFNLDNPAYLSIAQIISATTNIPLDRAARIMMNLKQAVDKDTEIWQRVSLMFGYSGWELGLPYWGLQTTIDKEKDEDEAVKTKYKNEANKLKTKGYKRIPMTKGKPDGKLNVDFIQVARPTGDLEYWLMPKK